MEVRDWLKRASSQVQRPVKQIVFKGDKVLNLPKSPKMD